MFKLIRKQPSKKHPAVMLSATIIVGTEVVEVSDELVEFLEWFYYDLYTLFVYEGPYANENAITENYWQTMEDKYIPDDIPEYVAFSIGQALAMQARKDAVGVDYQANYPVTEAIEPLPELRKLEAGNILVKMQENAIQDFSDEELERVFQHLTGPAYCRRVAKALILSGNLTSVNDIPRLINYGKPLYATTAVMEAAWG